MTARPTPLPAVQRLRATLVVAALGAAFGALQGALLYVGLKQEKGLPFTPSLGRLVAWQVASWLVWGALAPGILELAARFGPERPLRWLSAHVPAALAAACLHTAGVVAISRLLNPWGERPGRRLLDDLLGRITSSLPVELLVYAAIVGGSAAVDYYRRFRDRELTAAQLEGRLAEARLEALRLQLQPHFLFNALHTVAGLVRQGENPAAVEMLARLSELLRATLDGGGRPLVPLGKELALADLYLSIQRVRFADRLTVERHVDPGLADVPVPPFVLQPLLENAVRHGLGARAGAGWIRIAAERTPEGLRLEVQDDGQGLGSPAALAVDGVGLGNTRARLAQLFGDEGRLELLPRPEGGAIARVTLPIAGAGTEPSAP